MKSVFHFWIGFISGALVAGIATLLLTPSSGEGLRQQISSRTQKVQDEVNLAASQRRAELEAQLAALRKPRRAA